MGGGRTPGCSPKAHPVASGRFCEAANLAAGVADSREQAADGARFAYPWEQCARITRTDCAWSGSRSCTWLEWEVNRQSMSTSDINCLTGVFLCAFSAELFPEKSPAAGKEGDGDVATDSDEEVAQPAMANGRLRGEESEAMDVDSPSGTKRGKVRREVDAGGMNLKQT